MCTNHNLLYLENIEYFYYGFHTPRTVDMGKELELRESSSVFPLSANRFHEQGNDRPTCSSNTVVPTF